MAKQARKSSHTLVSDTARQAGSPAVERRPSRIEFCSREPVDCATDVAIEIYLSSSMSSSARQPAPESKAAALRRLRTGGSSKVDRWHEP